MVVRGGMHVHSPTSLASTKSGKFGDGHDWLSMGAKDKGNTASNTWRHLAALLLGLLIGLLVSTLLSWKGWSAVASSVRFLQLASARL